MTAVAVNPAACALFGSGRSRRKAANSSKLRTQLLPRHRASVRIIVWHAVRGAMLPTHSVDLLIEEMRSACETLGTRGRTRTTATRWSLRASHSAGGEPCTGPRIGRHTLTMPSYSTVGQPSCGARNNELPSWRSTAMATFVAIMEGVRFDTRLKIVSARWPTGIRAGAEYVMPTMR